MTESRTLIANQFIAANPIEFAIYNQEEEKVLYIVDNEADAHPLILELKNASPQTIELSTPDSLQKPKNLQGQELSWNDWKAGKDLYHFQLQFRPGTLSRNGKSSLRDPISRLAALSLGWDMNFDLNDADLTDWVSFLWVGTTQATNLTDTLEPVVVTSLEENEDFLKQYGISKNAADRKNLVQKVVNNLKTNARDTFHRLNPGFESIVTPGNNPKFELEQRRNYKIAIPNLSADAGGGARSTRIELNYDYLSYVISGESNRIPPGTRSQFINIINRRGQKYIPLHVGFVGSNTILNDGETENKLTLRITNISKDKPITFARKSESEASQFTLSVDSDDTDQPWILATKSQAVGIQVLVGRVDNVGKINGYDSPNADVEIILESPLERTINTNTRLLVPTEKSAPIRLETLTVRKEASQGSSRISVSQPSIASFLNGDVVYAVLDQSNENNWAVESPGSNDPRIRWIIKFNHDTPLILDPGESLEFQLLNIITASPVGYTNLYVNYEDIPGYWDGHFVVPIEKSPLVYRGNNVGIGTDEPKAKLHVAGDLQVNKIGIGIASGVEQLKVQGETAIVGNLSTTTLSATSTSTLTGKVGIGTAPETEQLKVQGNTAISGNLAITNTSTLTGNVGIGIAPSTEKLKVQGDTAIVGNLFVANGRIGIGSSKFDKEPLVIRAQGTQEGLIAFENPSGQKKWHIEQNCGGNSPGLNFVETNVADFRFFIKEGGNIGINTNDPKIHLAIGDNDTGIKWNKDGEIAIMSNGKERIVIKSDNVVIKEKISVEGPIWSNFTGNWLRIRPDAERNNNHVHNIWESDLQLKQNVCPLQNSLSKIEQLKPSSFYWKNIDYFLKKLDQDVPDLSILKDQELDAIRQQKKSLKAKLEKQQFGFIAQDVEQVFPDWVSTGEDGYKQISLKMLPPLLVQSIQELKKKIDELVAENKDLNNRLKVLENQFIDRANG